MHNAVEGENYVHSAIVLISFCKTAVKQTTSAYNIAQVASILYMYLSFYAFYAKILDSHRVDLGVHIKWRFAHRHKT